MDRETLNTKITSEARMFRLEIFLSVRFTIPMHNTYRLT